MIVAYVVKIVQGRLHTFKHNITLQNKLNTVGDVLDAPVPPKREKQVLN